MVDETTTPDVKPGVKTSEFYLHLAVVILGALSTVAGIVESYAHGSITPAGAIMSIGGVLTATINALGYTSARTAIKTAAALLLVLSLGGCSTNAQLTDLVLEGRDLLIDVQPQDADWQYRRLEFLSDSAPVDTRAIAKKGS